MLIFENFSNRLLSKKALWIFIISLTAFLFIVTGWIQFSCYPMVTSGVLPKFCNRPESVLKIIQDSRTHGNTLMILASDPKSDEKVLEALTSSLDSPKVANNVRMLQRTLAFNPKTPVDVLDAFVKSEDVGILESIAKRSNATPKLLREVANNPYAETFDVQKALVENPQVPNDVLQKLAHSKELTIVWETAKLKQAPPSVLRELYDNPIANKLEIQRILAWNKNTPEDVLQKLADLTDSRVLWNIINHPSANSDILERVGNNSILWKDTNIGLQRMLAEKPKISLNLIEKLAASKDRKILETFYHDNPSVPPELKEKYGKELGILPPVDRIDSTTPPPPPLEPPPPPPKKSNCLNKHARNNLIGGAAAGIGFFIGGPVGAGVAYSVVTGSMETLTSLSECQF